MKLFGKSGKDNQPNVEKLAAKRDVKGLINALNQENVFWYNRQHIVRALGNLGGNEVTDILAKALEDDSYDVQIEAALALNRRGYLPKNDTEKAYLLLSQKKYERLVDLGAPAVEALTHELDRLGGPIPANALIRIGEPAVEPVIKVLDAQAAWARYQAARILGEIGDARGIDAINRLLEKEKNNEVIEVAKNSMARIKLRNRIT